MKKYLLTILAAVFASLPAFSSMGSGGTRAGGITPDETYMFAKRDTCDLFMDIYNPAPGTDTLADGSKKPTIIFAFGGSFMTGSRDAENYLPWFRVMADNGYRIVSIDYRLGMKGYDKIGVFQVNALDRAIHMAVEDMISATVYLLDNAESLDIDPSRIVISGSSAGAITALQTDYETSNRTSWAAPLPDGFRYAGVMSFAGAVLSRNGKLKYAQEPAPTLLMHGTEDSVVPYTQIKIFSLGFFGSSKIAERFEKFGYAYNIFRHKGHNHEIAVAMYETVPEQLAFLKSNVCCKSGCCVDATVVNPEIGFPYDK
ncbi:MAG: alpha/beta hydrolase [Bacteroidetes bacterium]|uniref:Alpha/beta hydrolase n=1 Tax=Candidatus Cryptobacteroides faecipullorum TaxID=2840764 RepID=A0A9D9I5C1_9BACT|nr:alpha/beta hydrolase [Candidatus Cryptobacteroides faecipullorum]